MNTYLSAPQGGVFCAVLAFAVAGSLSVAQEAASPDIPEVELAPVTVSAYSGLAVPYDRTGVSVSVLDLPQLKAEGVDTLNEALSTVPGVSVQPNGYSQRGNVSNVAMRGMNSGQYMLPMMDGMRLYSVADANITPNVAGRNNLFSLGRLEVLRGAQGAVYGAGAMGGVMFMETPEGEGEPSLTLFNEAGSFDSYTGNAVAQGREGALSYYLSATYERTNNDIRFADRRPITVKHAGHYDAWNEALRLDYELNPDNKLTLTYRREDAGYRSVDVWGGATDNAFRTNLLTAKLATRVNESYSTSLMAGYYGMDNMYGHGVNMNLRNVQLEWRNQFRWNEQHSTTAGLAWNRSDYRSLSYWADSDKFDTLDTTCALFAEHLYSPTAAWNHSLALRWDESSVWSGLGSFRAASSYRLNDERTRLFASVGSGYKTPTALQRGGVYHGVYGNFIGNPSLDCEHSLSADAGVEHEWAEGHSLTATLFWSRVEDGITTAPAGEYTTWVNQSGHWTSQGMELAAQGTWEDVWKTGYRVAFTYTQPKDSHDRQLIQTARQVWSADVHTSPWEGFTTGIGLTATVGRTADFEGFRLDNYYCLRWYARYAWSEQLSVHLRVENLTNQEFISADVWGSEDQSAALLNRGAAVYAGCTYRF